jgi:hypothetical protein
MINPTIATTITMTTTFGSLTREAAMEAFAKSWRRPNIIPRCAVESFQPPSDDSFS